MKPKTVTYYEPCSPLAPTAVFYSATGRWFQQVTKPTTDKYLLDAVRLARRYGGMPWRDGDGITPDTRYGITQLS